MQYTIPTLLALAAAAIAAPTTENKACGSPGGNDHRFRMYTSSADNECLNMTEINASGYEWWVGKPTASYCPLEVGDHCPPGDVTSVVLGSESGTMGMNVKVPGGQVVYVTQENCIKYTQAHSNSMEPGSSTSGWSSYPRSNVEGYGQLFYNSGAQIGGKHGFLACTMPGAPEGVYKISVQCAGCQMPPDCEEIDILIPEDECSSIEGASAWQYT